VAARSEGGRESWGSSSPARHLAPARRMAPACRLLLPAIPPLARRGDEVLLCILEVVEVVQVMCRVLEVLVRECCASSVVEAGDVLPSRRVPSACVPSACVPSKPCAINVCVPSTCVPSKLCTVKVGVTLEVAARSGGGGKV
jgi:hypothetical protein